MNQQLNVYVGEISHGDRLVRALLAVRTRTEAIRILGIPVTRLEQHWHLTDDEDEHRLGLAHPYTLLVASDRFSIDYSPTQLTQPRLAA